MKTHVRFYLRYLGGSDRPIEGETECNLLYGPVIDNVELPVGAVGYEIFEEFTTEISAVCTRSLGRYFLSCGMSVETGKEVIITDNGRFEKRKGDMIAKVTSGALLESWERAPVGT